MIITRIKIFWNIVFAVCIMSGNIPFLSAQEDNTKISVLNRQIIEAKSANELYGFFEELKNYYFQNNKYNDFAVFLRSLEGKNDPARPFVSYYMALNRYYQLKHLEKNEDWDEYFSKGNAYRDELNQHALDAIALTATNSPLHLQARLLIWQFHKDQEDTFTLEALQELIEAAKQYSKDAQDLLVLKEVADRLNLNQEKAKAKEVYQLYLDNMINAEMSEQEIKAVAEGFYKDGNLDLSEQVFDIYIERAQDSLSKEELTLVLINIAKDFSSSASSGQLYAEKIFKKIEEIAGLDSFDEELIYLRAFNLEKTGEYPPAKNYYDELIKRYPASLHRNEACFKSGVIAAYALADIKAARGYFEDMLSSLDLPSGANGKHISSLYQLGILSQWENDFVAANKYFTRLVELANGNFSQKTSQAQQRLKEIAEERPMEHNLKSFLDIALAKKASLDPSVQSADLRVSPARVKKGLPVEVVSNFYLAASGCLPQEIQYSWSGDTGTSQDFEQTTFLTQYPEPGIWVLNLVVVSSSVPQARGFVMVDVE